LNRLLKENDYKMSLYEDHTEEGMKAPIVWANIERVFIQQNIKKSSSHYGQKETSEGQPLLIFFPLRLYLRISIKLMSAISSLIRERSITSLLTISIK